MPSRTGRVAYLTAAAPLRAGDQTGNACGPCRNSWSYGPRFGENGPQLRAQTHRVTTLAQRPTSKKPLLSSTGTRSASTLARNV